MIRVWLTPFGLAYGVAIRARNARYDRSPPLQLRWPVISVGNLSLGGSGKTPFVIRLAQLFQQERWRVDVLSRGYGRRGTLAERVDPSGSAGHFGDEPLLIARATGAPVFVAPSRYEAGQLAERGEENQERRGERHEDRRVHLLDDGFQHRHLARDVDIVLVHRSDLDDRLLPAGRLREPLASLKRADLIVLREEDADIEERLEPYAKGVPFWRVRRVLSPPLERKHALAFCAIARPEEFFQALEASGTELVGRISFRDHHRYKQEDVEKLRRLGALRGCKEFVTTEKDAVKLDGEMRTKLTSIAPLRVARLSVEIEKEDAAMAQLVAMLAPGRKS